MSPNTQIPAAAAAGRKPLAEGGSSGSAEERHTLSAGAAFMRSQSGRGLFWLAVLCAALAAATCLFVFMNLDCRLSALLYDSRTGWYMATNPFWRIMYRFGPAPGLVLTLASLAGLVGSLYSTRLRVLRQPLAVVLLTAIMGAGFIVNAVLKPYWGRPRPRETVMYGGGWEYRAPYEIGTPGRGKSFPCGHCTMGYLFVALLAFRRRAPVAAAAGAAFGLIFGTIVGIARMVQGAHFATDVLWSLGIMLMVYVAMEYLIAPRMTTWLKIYRTALFKPRFWPAAAVSSMAILGLGVFLTFRPVYETYSHALPLTALTRQLTVEAGEHLTAMQIRWVRGGTAIFRVDAQGIGWINSRLAERMRVMPEGDRALRVTYRLKTKGLYAELSHRVEIILPDALKGHITIRLAGPGKVSSW